MASIAPEWFRSGFRLPRWPRLGGGRSTAFAEPALYGKLEQSGYRYAIRLKSNPVLERRIARLLVRPVGRPSRRPKVFYVGFHYQAKSWDRKRRVVAKVEWHANELFPRVGFIVTNPAWQARIYNGRGTAEQWIKEGKNAVRWTRLSCQTFRANHARLQLFALAYNLGNFLRHLALSKSVRHRSLTTFEGVARQESVPRSPGTPGT